MIIQGLFRLNSIVIMEIKLLQLINIVCVIDIICTIEFGHSMLIKAVQWIELPSNRVSIESINTFLVHDNERIFLALNDNSRFIQIKFDRHNGNQTPSINRYCLRYSYNLCHWIRSFNAEKSRSMNWTLIKSPWNHLIHFQFMTMNGSS